MSSDLAPELKEALFQYLLRLGDDALVLGHRLSEWCGHGPILEEDIALANIGLDLLGQATNALQLAGEVEGKGRSEDDLAYFREAIDFRNVMLVEQPNGDFGQTIVRQYLFSSFSYLHYTELCKSQHQELAGLAEKALKEIRYHLRHSSEWMLRLGDGTEESHRRVSASLEELWTYTDELFGKDAVDEVLIAENIVPDRSALRDTWRNSVAELLAAATLEMPSDERYMAEGAWQGRHSEHLGFILAEMQTLPRAYPDAKW